MSSHISLMTWVRRGVALRNPEKYKLDEAEMARAHELIRSELENVDEADVVDGDGGDEWVECVLGYESWVLTAWKAMMALRGRRGQMDEGMDVVDYNKDHMSKFNLGKYEDE